MRWKIVGYIFGTSILAAGIVMFSKVATWPRVHHVNPLSVPLSLAPGTAHTFHVTIDDNRNYDIVITAKAGELKGESVEPDIKWRLSDSSKTIAEGNTVGQPSEDWGGTIGQRLGNFAGQAGHSYTLMVSAESNTSRLAAANPVLEIQIPRGYWEDHAAGIAIREMESWIVGFAGLLTIGVTFLISKISNKRRTAGLTAHTL